MTDLPKMPYIDLIKSLRKVRSANEAVREGIATHAELERAARDERYHKLESERPLPIGSVKPNAG